MAIPYLNDIDLNQNELQNAVIQSLGTAPTGKAGQVYYNSGDKCLYLHNGTAWVRVGVTYDMASGSVSNNAVPITLTGSNGETDTIYIKGAGGATITQSSGTITITTSDTKNTAGSTDSNSKLFIIGATSQAANPQTYSQDTAYVGTDGHLYSNSKQVVNLSDSQALTNKTYNGYTLAGASAKAVDTSITAGSTSTNLPTTKAVNDFVTSQISAAHIGVATFKGTVNATADISGLTNYKKGWYWVVATAGTYAGQACEVGDMIYCISDYSSSFKNADFSIVQNNIQAADAYPIVAGTAAVGTSTKYARQDHVHPAQTSVSGNAGTATTLQTSRKIDGVSFDGSADIFHFGISDTDTYPETVPGAHNGQYVKYVTLTGNSTFSLVTGAIVAVKFTGSNGCSPGNLELNVNNTGNVPIDYRTSDWPAHNLLNDNNIYFFVYTGTRWEIIGDLDDRPIMTNGTATALHYSTPSTTGYLWSPAVLQANVALKYTETNPEITPASGIATWTVTHGLRTQFPVVAIYEVSSNKQVMAEVVATSTTVCTINMIVQNSQLTNGKLAAGTYRVVVHS